MSSQPTNPGQGTTGSGFVSTRKGAIVAHLRAKDTTARGGAIGSVTRRA